MHLAFVKSAVPSETLVLLPSLMLIVLETWRIILS